MFFFIGLGVAIVYIGNYFEWSNGVSTKCFYTGSTRIAMRVVDGATNPTYWLLDDHLSSTAITADSTGARFAELRFKAWGETRFTYGSTPTTYRYTGQREQSQLSIYFYGSRYYDPSLSRFIQPDTIVPEEGSTQAWDRYAYTLNNPLKYIDPSGHDAWWCQTASCSYNYYSSYYNYYYHYSSRYYGELNYIKLHLSYTYGITLDDTGGRKWDLKNARIIDAGMANQNKTLNGRFQAITGSSAFTLNSNPESGHYYGETSKGRIDFYTSSTIPYHNLYHETGHLLDIATSDAFEKHVGETARKVGNNYIFGGKGVGVLNAQDPGFGFIARDVSDPNWGDVDAIQALVDTRGSPSEQWADLYANVVSGNIDMTSPAGLLIHDFVTSSLVYYAFP